mmetsp:Transcript_9264/g.12877  ORF Transcript_9264/g.12877 Transcript_9264/m.12877 type:complete len:305 (+) Transcript_9264:1-915(+)
MHGLLRRAPGPWSPTVAFEPYSAVDQYFPKTKPSALDVRCKESLEKMLKPCNLKVITPLLDQFKDWEKQEIVKLAECAGVLENLWGPVIIPRVASDTELTNYNGRTRLEKAVHVSADKAQADMLRNRCKSDQKDTALHKKRQHFSNYSQAPSVDSVSSYYRLGSKSILSESSSKLLNERARKGLAEWQVRGPEADRVLTAQVMHSLENIHDVLKRQPQYTEIAARRGSGPQARSDALYEHALNLPRCPTLPHSRSLPTVIARPPPPEDFSKLTRPGGSIVQMHDSVKLQREKNAIKSRASKVVC